jgi:hypothetical protein
MFHIISQHFTWPSLCTQVENFAIATLAKITRHKGRNMDTYLLKTSNKLLTHGTWLPMTPSDHGSFCSHTFFEIHRANNSSSPYNHWSIHTLHGNHSIEKQGKHHHRSHLRPSLALLLPPPSWLFTWQWYRIHQHKIPRTSSIIWNQIQIDHC